MSKREVAAGNNARMTLSSEDLTLLVRDKRGGSIAIRDGVVRRISREETDHLWDLLLGGKANKELGQQLEKFVPGAAEAQILPVYADGELLGIALRKADDNFSALGAVGNQTWAPEVQHIEVEELPDEDKGWLLWLQLVIGSLRDISDVAAFVCEAVGRRFDARSVHLHLDGLPGCGEKRFVWSEGHGVRREPATLSDQEKEILISGNARWTESLDCEGGAAEPGPWFLVPVVSGGTARAVLAVAVDRRDHETPRGLELVGRFLSRRLQEAFDVSQQLEMAGLFRTAVEENPDPITVQDRDFRIVYANAAARQLLGVSGEELHGRRCYEVFHGTSSPPPDCPAVEAVGKPDGSWEETFYDPNLGRWIWVRASWQFDTERRRALLIHTVRDVSEVRRTEEKLRQAVSELEASWAHLRSVVETVPVGIFTLDADGRIVHWNEEAENLTGLSKAAVLGQVCPFVATHRGQRVCPLLEHPKRDERGPVTIRWTGAGEKHRYLRVNCRRSGRGGGCVGSISDVTISVERRRQNRLLLRIGRYLAAPNDLAGGARKLSAALLRRTDATAICVYSYDAATGVPELLAQAGLARDSALRLRRKSAVSRGWARVLERLGQKRAFRIVSEEAPEAWRATWGDGRLYLVVPITAEDVLGFLLVVEKATHPLPDWQVDFLEAVGREISATIARSLGLAEIARQAQRLQLLHDAGQAFLSSMELDSMLHAVAATFDRHMPRFLCSIHLLDAEKQKHTVKAASGPNASSYVGRELPLGRGLVSEALRSGSIVYVPDVRNHPHYVMWHEPSRSELVIPLRVKDRVIGALNVESPKVDGFGEEDFQTFTTLSAQLSAAIGNIQLFDEVVRTSENLAIQSAKALEASRLKSQFLSIVSHELRTPLNAILGYAKRVLGSEPRLSTEGKESLQRVITAGQHLLQLINDLLDLSRIEAGKMEIHRAEVDLRRLAIACLATVEPAARDKGLELRLEMPSDAGTVFADPLRLKQMVLNLLSNAVKFTNQGSVTLRVRSDDANVYIDVVDTGIGIDRAHQEIIFDSFRQVDSSATRQAGGTGLGLTISRKLARLMGGDIAVESQTGKGSTFTIRLPRITSS